MTDDLNALLIAHAANVEESARAWSIMCEAQQVSRETREREHKSAEAIEEYLKRAIEPMIGDIHKHFKPVKLDIEIETNFE